MDNYQISERMKERGRKNRIKIIERQKKEWKEKEDKRWEELKKNQEELLKIQKQVYPNNLGFFIIFILFLIIIFSIIILGYNILK